MKACGEIVRKNIVIAAIVLGIIVIGATVFILVSQKPSEGGAPIFTISVSPSTLTINRGGSDNLTINFEATQLPESLGYEVEGLPVGVQYSGAPGPFTPPNPPTTFVLTFTVAEDTATGSYSAMVICEDMNRSLTSSDNFTLVITA